MSHIGYGNVHIDMAQISTVCVVVFIDADVYVVYTFTMSIFNA